MKKPAIIKKLEKLLVQELHEVYFENMLHERGYSLDSRGKVIGLNLNNLYIDDLSILGSLTSLKNLYLLQNQITDISPIAALTSLEELYLQYNNISDLTPLSQMAKLEILSIGSNRITDLSPIGALTGLKELHIYKNQITDISPLAGLTALTYLNASQNKIKNISVLSSLIQLRRLELCHNQIVDFSPLAFLPALEKLWLSNNAITDISPIRSLTFLNRLELGDNHISDLSSFPPSLNSKQLVILNLTGNHIKFLPPDIFNKGRLIKWEWDGGSGFFFKGNPLESPPIEIIARGHNAVAEYFKQLEKRVEKLLQCKLLIVGNGEVGKTTLLKKLKYPSFQVEIGKEETTHGINIIPWQVDCVFNNTHSEPVKISFWDFGGQDIYHATHQFFLSKRSLYLFVWDARKEEDARTFEYWLSIIHLLGKNSPVIVVMNKSDVRIKSIDQATLKAKFPNIFNFIQVSCITGSGMDELTTLIRQTLGKMSHLQDSVPAIWMHIREELKGLKVNYIEADRYFDICKKHGLEHKNAEVLSDYLHDLGIILYFREDTHLADTVILNPEWVTKAIYSLIDEKEISANKGRFHLEDLQRYWNPDLYPHKIHKHIVRLMEKFELCFNLLGTDKYLIPELLPGEPIKLESTRYQQYQQPSVIQFQYHYEFMPEGILSRLISRLHHHIDPECSSKYSVEIQVESSSALVFSEPLNRRIRIMVTGADKMGLLAIIRKDFNLIHRTLNMEDGIHYKQKVPCTLETCPSRMRSDVAHLFPYDTLKKYQSKGKKTITCYEEVAEVEIESMLIGVEPSFSTGNLFKTVINAALKLQGSVCAVKQDEDSRTSVLAMLLEANGVVVHNQNRWGRSESGKSQGRPDITIHSPERVETVLEAFRLSTLDKKVIDSHCRKIFDYDPNGLEHNFILVYSESPDFYGLWEKYMKYVEEITHTYPLSNLTEVPTSYADIKAICVNHCREGKQISLYHVFINMSSKTKSE